MICSIERFEEGSEIIRKMSAGLRGDHAEWAVENSHRKQIRLNRPARQQNVALGKVERRHPAIEQLLLLLPTINSPTLQC